MRPKTLAEVAQLTLNGESFDRCLANFLDEFSAAPNAQALAVSPDGGKVYVAFALSGNRTTVIPREKAPDQPDPTRIPDAPPKVALIVDAEDPAWADHIPYTMPDNDVAEIDADSLAVTRYFSRLGTVNLGLGVHPHRSHRQSRFRRSAL